MSFNPTGPAVGPGPVPGPMPAHVPGTVPGAVRTGAAPRSEGSSLVAAIGAGAMLLVELVLLLASLIASGHVGYLGVLFGLSSDYISAPTQFVSWDVALCGVLAAGVFGCLGGRNWGRSAVLATMVMVGYPNVTSLLSELRTGDGRSAFTQGHNLWFNLIMILEVILAVGTFVAVLAASSPKRSATAPGAPTGPLPGVGAMPMGAPAPGYPQQPAPGYAPQPTPSQAQPPAPGYPQQPAPGYGQPPAQQQAQPPAPGYPQQGQGQPPAQQQPLVPPQAGPVQQPTPTQEAMAYRPTEFSPPPQAPHGQPPVPPGA